MIYRGPDFFAVEWFGSLPTSSPLSPLDARPATIHRKTEKERQLDDGRGVEEGGRGADSEDHKNAWSSINHSILSAAPYTPQKIFMHINSAFKIFAAMWQFYSIILVNGGKCTWDKVLWGEMVLGMFRDVINFMPFFIRCKPAFTPPG